MDTSSLSAMPLLFLGHGNPMYAIERNEFTETIRSLSPEIPTPRAILCISAHWETRGTQVTGMPVPRTIHDFGGFPQELFAVQYPASGSPALANEVKNMRSTISIDSSWGLDHGTWSVLKHLYPQANIPVVQLSLDYTKSPKEHYELASGLSQLRNNGVLIVASGNMVYNLGMIDWPRMHTIGYGYDWAIEAQTRMNSLIINGDDSQLIEFTHKNKAFQLAAPTPEHFLPLLYILAMKDRNEPAVLFNDKLVGGSLSMTSVAIGL